MAEVVASFDVLTPDIRKVGSTGPGSGWRRAGATSSARPG
jgi:hypothetical protein